ncbi:MAG: EamA family transporter [Lachnospiraceae bacterium]|nr:EamA family transporter [Lachnospiraceae bacterium]
MVVKEKKFNPGPLFAILTGLSFSIGGLCIKNISWSPLAINGARSLIAVIVFGIFLLATKHKLKINVPVIIGALSVSLTTILYTTANKMTTAGNTVVLEFTAPIFVLLLEMIIFRKKPTKLDVVATILIFAGIVCFFVDSLSAGNMLGNFLALLSGITYAGVFMMGEAKGADSRSSTFFGMCINIIVCLPFVFREDIPATQSNEWIALIALGVVQVGLAYVFLNLSLKTTSAVVSCLMVGIEPILNPILVAVFYGEHLSTLSIIGAVIVIISILVYNLLKLKKVKVTA